MARPWQVQSAAREEQFQGLPVQLTWLPAPQSAEGGQKEGGGRAEGRQRGLQRECRGSAVATGGVAAGAGVTTAATYALLDQAYLWQKGAREPKACPLTCGEQLRRARQQNHSGRAPRCPRLPRRSRRRPVAAPVVYVMSSWWSWWSWDLRPMTYHVHDAATHPTPNASLVLLSPCPLVP